jgi:two-component system, NarL family, response regulator LiaR
MQCQGANSVDYTQVLKSASPPTIRVRADREREVLMLVAQGKTDQEIADNLKIKVKTVGHHLSRILCKLEVASRTEAAVWAINEGFADKGSSV